MAISCPTCGRPASLSGAASVSGRMVRCQGCSTSFLARAPRNEVFAPPRTPLRTDTVQDISDAIIVDEPPVLTRPAMPPPGRRHGPLPQKASMPTWLLATIGFVAAAGVAFLAGPLMAALPGSGVAQSAADSGLAFRDVTSQATQSATGLTLVITGNIVNTLATTVSLPQLKIALKGINGTEVATWLLQPTVSSLAPGQVVAFRSARPVPPGGATAVSVSLAD